MAVKKERGSAVIVYLGKFRLGTNTSQVEVLSRVSPTAVKSAGLTIATEAQTNRKKNKKTFFVRGSFHSSPMQLILKAKTTKGNHKTANIPVPKGLHIKDMIAFGKKLGKCKAIKSPNGATYSVE